MMIPMSDRPNILFVFGDQWRSSAVGYAGNPDVKTPHIDALAARSLRIEHCIANTPVCCPWRASMLTGTYPHKHGVYLNDGVLSPNARTFGETFAEAGYDTAWVGKWHVSGRGRDHYIPRDNQHRFEYWRALECTHDYNNSQYYADDDPTPRTWEGYDAIAQTDDLIGWLASRHSASPFLAFLSWGPPHNPYHTAPAQYRQMYDPAKLALLPNVPEEAREKAAEDLAGYYAHCTALDDCMGKLLAAIDEQGLADDTIVVFTSDHGDHIGSFGMWEKAGPWETALRVPMLLHDPSAPHTHGQSSEVVFSMVDHLPTLCGLAGIDAPPQVQGDGLSDHLMKGTTPTDNQAVYMSCAVYGTWLKQDQRSEPLYHCREARGLRTTRYMYAEDRDGPWLLYDLQEDPHQLSNRVNEAAMADVQSEMAQRLQNELAKNDDPVEPGEALWERFYAGDFRGQTFERRGE